MSPSKPTSRQFEMQLEIAAPRGAVWSAISSDTELRRWFAPDAKVVPRVGGEILWRWGDLHAWPQVIEIWEPGSRLRTRYDSSIVDGEGGKLPLFLDFFLEGEGGRTTLRLVHSGFGPEATFDEEYDGISRGWPVELRSLRLYLERHAGLDRRLAWCTTTIDLAPAEAWERLTGEEGLAAGSALDALTEGDPFRFTTPAGDVFEGLALCCESRAFSGVATSHGDGFLRIAVEKCGGEHQVWLWLAAYGPAGPGLDELEARWSTMLERLFSASGTMSAGV